MEIKANKNNNLKVTYDLVHYVFTFPTDEFTKTPRILDGSPTKYFTQIH